MSWGQWDAVIPRLSVPLAGLVSVCPSQAGCDQRLQVCKGRVCSEHPAMLWKVKEREKVLLDFTDWSYTAFILIVLNGEPDA